MAIAQVATSPTIKGPTPATNPMVTTTIEPTMPVTADDSYVGTSPQNIGVMDRARPRYDPKGIPLDAFRLFPTVELVSSYDSNVFRQSSSTSDWYAAESAAARLVSQWGRHFFEVYGGTENFNYSTNSQLDLTDWTVGTDGRLDVMHGAEISAILSYAKQHESLSSPNTVGNQYAPNRYDKVDAKLGASYEPNRLGVEASASFDRYIWGVTPLIGGGLLNNSDRNEDELETSARLSYDFSPGYTGFIKASYDSRSFDEFLDRGGVHRSSTGYLSSAGLSLRLANLIQGDVYLGYLTQHYAQDVASPLRSMAGLDFGAAMDWFAAPLLTVHLNASHTLTDVTVAGSSASSDETVRVSADYEMTYNVIVRSYIGYTHSQFIGIVRTDEYPIAGISGRYLVNEYIGIDLAFNYSARWSNTPVDFSDNLLTVTIIGHV